MVTTMKSKAVYLFLFVVLTQINLILMKSEEMRRKNNEDLHVEAYASSLKILHLNVTVLKPLESKYDVSITPVPSNESKHCSKYNDCNAYDVPSNQTTIIFPKNELHGTELDCKIENDCYYSIKAKTIKGSTFFNTTYHVKECVNGESRVCLCKNAEMLPMPTINLTYLDQDRMSFRWEIPPNINNSYNDLALDHMSINIKELRDCDTSWTDTKEFDSLSVNLRNYGIPGKRKNDFTRDVSNITDVKCLLIRLRVYDNETCHGPQVNMTVHLKPISFSDVHVSSFRVVIICLAAVLTVAVIIMIIYGSLLKSLKKNILNYIRGIYHNVQPGGTQMVPMHTNPLYFDKEGDDWFEIPQSCIREVGREIGKGAFGRVFIGRISDVPGKIGSQIVAIKRLKKSPTTDQLEEFLGEISTMKKVGKHPNVVRLLGFCKQPLMMIMEFVPCGDLLKYLRTVRAKHESTLKGNNTNNCTNSNINNNSNNTSVKHSSSSHSHILGPLGKYLDILHSHSTSSASETSYITQPDSLPSTALMNGSGPSHPSFAETMYTNLTAPSNPELMSMISTNLEYVVDHKELHNFAFQISRGMNHLQNLQITHRDLAARNILIDENKTLKISDFGLSRSGIYVNPKHKKVPLRWLSIEAMKDNLYSSKSDVWAFAIVLWEIGTLGGFPYPTVSNHELLNFLKVGERLEKPENCSESLYELMLHCWENDPDARPDFADICRKLDPNKSKIYIDFNELDPSYVFPPTSDEVTKTAAGKLSQKV